MRFYLILWILTGCILLFIFGGLIFSWVVPIDFTTSVVGIVEPQQYNLVTVPTSGRVIFIGSLGSMKTNDILLCLDSQSEESNLNLLREILALQNEQILLQEKIIELMSLREQQQREKIETQLKITQQRYDLLKNHLLPLWKQMETIREKSVALSERYRTDELRVLQELASMDLIPQRELRQAEFNAELIQLQKEENQLQGLLTGTNYQQESLLLQQSLIEQTYQTKEPSMTLPYQLELIRLKREQKRLELECLELERSIRRCIIRAPYDGEVAYWYVRIGDYITIGQPVAFIIGAQPLLFRGKISSTERLRIAKRQQVLLELTDYPALTYGYFQGTVQDVETQMDLPSRQITYYVRIQFTKREGLPLYPGIQGKAQIYTFRGTLFQYFQRGTDPRYILSSEKK